MGRHGKPRKAGVKFDYVIVDEITRTIVPGGKPAFLIEREYTSEELGWVPPTPITRGEELLLVMNSVRSEDWWLWK